MKTRTSQADPQPEEPGADDATLMVAFQRGDGAAFETLVHRHRRGLFNFLLRSVGNRSRAEEMLQEVFLRVVRAKNRYEPRARFSTWVYTIARNLCVDESRRGRLRREVSLEAPRRMKSGDSGGSSTSLRQTVAAAQSNVGPGEAAQIRARLGEAVEELPQEQREVFVLRQVNGLSFKEIAAIVEAPENTVKSRMRYALEKLRSELRDLDPRTMGAETAGASANV
ncbi:MAG: RNA polymerase sigma factor [Nannocystaceae bacterium]